MEAINQDWASLPEDIWYSILEKLESSKDFLRCGVVCHKWHALVKSYKRGFNLLHQAPMLIVPNHTENNKWNIFDTMSNKKLEKSEPVMPHDMSLCGSSLGWLVAMSDQDSSLTLFKPFDKERIIAPIRLPLLFSPKVGPDDYEQFEAYIFGCHIHVLRAWISADPIENPDDCVVVGRLTETRELVFTRPATDESWTAFDIPRCLKFFYGVVFDDDNQGFHTLADHGALAYISLVNLEVKWVVWRKPLPEGSYTAHRYLVKSRNGELLRVDRLLGTCSGKRETKITRVFKLLAGDGKKGSWVMVKTLGGAALFLGDNSSICVRASDFVGCRPNCIYFTDDFETIGYTLPGPYHLDLCVYCLEDESYTRHYQETSHNFVTGMKVQPPMWVTPTLNI